MFRPLLCVLLCSDVSTDSGSRYGRENESRRAFDGSGFHNWKFRMETVINMYGLLDCVHQEIAEIGELREMADDSAQGKREGKANGEDKCRGEEIWSDYHFGHRG